MTDATERETLERQYIGHGNGVVVTQENGVFHERTMTEAESAARLPALAIAARIHELAIYAGLSYIKIWEAIARAMQTLIDTRDSEIADLKQKVETLEAACRLKDDASEILVDRCREHGIDISDVA